MNLKQLQQEMEKEIKDGLMFQAPFQLSYSDFVKKYMQKVADMYEKKIEEKDEEIQSLRDNEAGIDI
jgi:hypothetical protein